MTQSIFRPQTQTLPKPASGSNLKHITRSESFNSSLKLNLTGLHKDRRSSANKHIHTFLSLENHSVEERAASNCFGEVTHTHTPASVWWVCFDVCVHLCTWRIIGSMCLSAPFHLQLDLAEMLPGSREHQKQQNMGFFLEYDSFRLFQKHFNVTVNIDRTNSNRCPNEMWTKQTNWFVNNRWEVCVGVLGSFVGLDVRVSLCKMCPQAVAPMALNFVVCTWTAEHDSCI